VLHLSAAPAPTRSPPPAPRGSPVTVETCPHYLTLAAEEIADGATATKCAPRSGTRPTARRCGRRSPTARIDAIVSDHSPAPPELKHLDDGDFVAAWGGIASLQLGPSLVWTEARRRGHDLADLVRWMAGRAGPGRRDDPQGVADAGRTPTWSSSTPR
jgi:allantoinase